MKKKELIPLLILFIVLVGSSFGIYHMYPTIYENAKKESLYINLENYITDYTSFYNYVIDYHTKGYNQGYSYYLDNQTVNYNKKEFLQDFQNYENELKEEKNLYYYAIDTKTKKIYTNTHLDLKNIKNNQNLQNQFLFYYQISFDENGNISVPLISQQINELSDTDLSFLIDNTYCLETQDSTKNVTLSQPKNITITYAIPKNLQSHTRLYNILNTQDEDLAIKYSFPYITIALVIVMITMLLIPFQKIKDFSLFHFISNIKLEILALLWTLCLSVISYFLYLIMNITLTNDIITIYQYFAVEYMANIMTLIINVLLWFIFLSLWMILVFMMKYLFHKGLIRYLKENTCLFWIINQCQQLISYIANFDFDQPIHKLVLKVVVFNFLVICIISVFFVAGPLIALVYSIILFIILKKKFYEIHHDYQILLTATQALSNGQFDYEINEDIGMFNPLKQEISDIKNGFSKAVEQEVKSQKMKTELISNVSHDLKTPLTSIITYIDLLKDSQLNEQQRQDYLQILEKNSLRLKNLIDDLFEVSKVNSGNIKLDIVNVDIISIIKQVELEHQDQMQCKNLDIRYHFPQEKIICPLDSLKTYRIFENLFINISKYALNNTRVYIEVKNYENDVIVIFKNISQEEMNFNEDEIVERFVQGDKSRNTSGSGLGLAIVKSFVEIQGGLFHVDIDGDLFKTTIQFKKKSEPLKS